MAPRGSGCGLAADCLPRYYLVFNGRYSGQQREGKSPKARSSAVQDGTGTGRRVQ